MTTRFHASTLSRDGSSAPPQQRSGGAGPAAGANGTAWAAGARSRKAFEPLPVRTSIPGLKSVEQDLQEQVRHLYATIQEDLDSLHGQLISEVYNSVAQELQAVAQRLGAVRGELGAETEQLRGSIGQLEGEARSLRAAQEEDRAAALENGRQASERVSQDLSGKLQGEVGTLRQEAKDLETRLLQSIMEVCEKVEEEGAAGGEQREQGTAELQKALDARAAELERRLSELSERVRSDAEAERAERSKLGEAVEQGHARTEGTLAQLEEDLRGQALVSEARFQESQAALAALEERQAASLKEAFAGASGQAEQKDLRIKYELETLKASIDAGFRDRLAATDEKLARFGEECREELDFARSSWARSVDWTADIDPKALEQAAAAGSGGGARLTIEGPVFTAAGLRPLTLQLRLTREGKSHRWACGAFLRAPSGGRVSFKLSVLGRGQSFTADFGESAEWGSQKLAILERVPDKLTVTLEILDVVAPVQPSLTGGVTAISGRGAEDAAIGSALAPATELSASLRIVDPVQAAAKEAAALRASMVRRVEWRIARVSERLAAAREAAAQRSGGGGDDEEALEPLCSPPFAAAGFEGLQLQLYPLGYRPRNEESCGFFLVCPRGMYVKCKAFVGDAVRTFEHQYDAREPYGRGSFCRLADKVDGEDSIIVGIEFLEVRQEQTALVRGGPFGNIADQLKVVTSPSVGGMEIVRELREIQGEKDTTSGARRGSRSGARQSTLTMRGMGSSGAGGGQAPSPAGMRATAPPGGLAQQLRDSKSLPSLLPTVGAIGAATGVGSMPMSPPPKQVDSFKFRA